MTMYPFLTGFWASAGLSFGLLFILLFLHNSGGNFPVWMTQLVGGLVYLAPFVGLGYTWVEFVKRRHRETTRSTLRRRFTGAILGVVVILISAALLLPVLQK